MFKPNMIIICAMLYLVVFATIAQAQLPQISSGLSYLTTSQNPGGAWNTSTQVETTAATMTALESLKALNQTTGTPYTTGVSWLQSQSPTPVDYQAQRIHALGLTDTSINTIIPQLDQLKHAWGGDDGYETDNLDTASALQALKSASYADQTVISGAISYLLSTQNSDGGWGFAQGGDSNVFVTARVVSALAQFKDIYQMNTQLASAAAFLVAKQNTDGGFGSSPSTVYETALGFIALTESGQTQGLPLQNAINYLTTTQSTNGSWNDDPYSTALALRALANVKPDLSVLPANITVLPSSPTVGGSLAITATINNIGLEAATNVTVRLQDNGVTAGEQTIASIAPGGTGQATFAISPLTPAGEHKLTIIVDPVTTIDEISKANNSATLRIWAKAPADLVVQPEYLTITPAYPKPGESVTLTAKIANMGESAASAFTVDLFDGNPNKGGTKLGSFPLPGIASGEWGTGSIAFSLATEGQHTLYLVADQLHAVNETSTENNIAQKTVNISSVGNGFLSDLSIPMNGIQLNPQRPHSGENVTITLLAVNLGVDTTTAALELFDGDPANGGILLHKSVVALSTGETRTVTVPWQIPAGTHTLRAYIDRANTIAERDKTNNSQFLTVMTDMVDIEISASDIVIEPEHPMDDDPATVKLTIQNRGISPTGPFNVNLYNGDPNSGGILLQSFAITDLAGDAARTVTYPFNAARGTYRFYAVCDPEKVVAELSEDNNIAIRSLLVKTSAEAKGPDLVPLEFDLSGSTTDPQSLRLTGIAKVKFQNKGDDKIVTPFRVTVFEDKDGDGVYTEGTDLSLGYWDYATPMNPNMAGEITINLSGTVSFRDAPIYAMVDSGQVVFEQNKDNNTIRKGSACESRPANPIEPVLKWKWETANDPTFGRILSTPVIINLNDDNGDGKIDNNDKPSILVNANSGDYYADGKLWAFKGDTGEVSFTRFVTDQAPYEGYYPAVGDIDGDGNPEIVIKRRIGEGLLALAHDGTSKWDNSAQVTAWRLANPFHNPTLHDIPVLADLDGDGHPEIISGPTIINWDGSVRCAPDYRLGGGMGMTNGFGYSVSVADMDMDGKQEIIAGYTAYNNDCTIKWTNTSLTDGLTAVGNFDDEPYPEVVLVTSQNSPPFPSGLGGRVYLLDHNGQVKWGPIYLKNLEPTAKSDMIGGHPIISDFDGDGKPEIGIRGESKYLILGSNGQLKKTLDIPNTSFQMTVPAPTVFDLNGDGRPKVLIHSGQYFRIFDGKDGSLLYKEYTGQIPENSQSVIVADVNGDGHAEVVVSGNTASNMMSGNIRVYGAKNNDWVGARRIWNQPSYHVTNINDDGSIPQYEAPSWLTNNNYRCQAQTSTGPSPYLATDLSASSVRVDMSNYPGSVTITARIGNGGAKQTAAGIRTAFYNGDPANGGVLIGSSLTTKTLNPGDYEDVTLVWNTPAEGNHTIFVNADADNTLPECDKTNNSVSAPVYIASGKPDLSIVTDDIIAPATIPEGNLAPVLVTVRNIGTLQADNVLVRLYAGNPASGGKQIGSDQTVPTIAAGGAVTLKTTWSTLGATGVSYLYALVDPASTTADVNRGNNTSSRQVVVTAAVKPDLMIASGDITIAAASPLGGDTLPITATIHNLGAQTGNIKVALYDGIPSAGGVKRAETIIPQIIAQGGSAHASFTLDTISLSGSHALYVRIDPDNSIDESDKTNNQASRNVSISATGLTVSIATDKSAYSANENVLATISLAEQNNTVRSLTYDLLVLDANGVQAASLAETALTLGANASLNIGKPWNSGSTYAGSYTIMVRIRENSRIIAKATAAIAINPAKTADAKIVVDKTSYHANEQVAINAIITGTSPNYIFSDLSAKTSVNDSTGKVLFTATQAIPSLTNGQRVEIKNYWNTGTLAPGTYPAVIEVKDGTGTAITTATRNIVISSAIAPSTVLKGTITADNRSLLSGEPVNVSFNLTNVGNTDLSTVSLSVLTVHVVNQTVYSTLTYQTALAMGTSYAGTGQIDTTGLTAKDYLVILRAKINDVEETLASTYFRVEGAPSAPALISPANGADVDSFTPALTVSNASDPNDDKLTYEFEIYSDNGLTNLVNSSGAVAETAGSTVWTVSAPLTENQTYFWRARAYDGKLYGPWMETATFRVNTVNDPPTAPVISSPVDNGIVSSLTPELTVLNATDPDSPSLTYNFDLALDSAFTQLVSSTTGSAQGTGTTSWQVPVPLAENTTYYWRSRADDWIVEGPWSTTGRFFVSTVNDPPSAPVIIAPVKGAILKALEADITLQNSTDPDSPDITYAFELDTVPTFDSGTIIRSGVIQQGQNSTTWHVTGLTEDTQYYVRAKASDGQAESAWSGIVDFFTNATNSAPTAPTLANPSNGAGVTVFTPTLSVNNSTDPDRDILTYEFQLFADVALTSLVTNIAGVTETDQTTSWTVPVTLTENKTYYWQARASDGKLQSPWMAQASFTINTADDAPGAPVLISPANGSTIDTLTPALVITNAKDPDNDKLTYEYEVYQGNVLITGITSVPENGSGETSAVLAANLADNTVYQWRARAFDGERYGPWTTMASFTVHSCQHKLQVDIDVEPDTLNKKDCGKWVLARIELPHGYRARDVDISSIRLEDTVPAELWPCEYGHRHHERGCGHDRHGHHHEALIVKFRRSEVIKVLPEGKHVPVHVTGMTKTTPFEGADIIRVTSSGHCCGGH